MTQVIVLNITLSFINTLCWEIDLTKKRDTCHSEKLCNSVLETPIGYRSVLLTDTCHNKVR